MTNTSSLYCIHPSKIEIYKIENLITALQNNANLPPIKVYWYIDKYIIIDGNHRAIAAHNARVDIEIIILKELPEGFANEEELQDFTEDYGIEEVRKVF